MSPVARIGGASSITRPYRLQQRDIHQAIQANEEGGTIPRPQAFGLVAQLPGLAASRFAENYHGSRGQECVPGITSFFAAECSLEAAFRGKLRILLIRVVAKPPV
jgi:hypothetical protein